MPRKTRHYPPPRKYWGQHFLVDPNLVRKVIATIDPRPEDVFLEIGPGHGELTLPLAEQAAAVTAVEIDPLLVEVLQATIPSNVSLIRADILKVNPESMLPAGCRVFSALPYYITTPIIFRLLDYRDRWQDAYFIIQREVAERMAAAPGGKDYGRLSVMVQAYAAVERCFRLGAAAFRPKPKVDSVLVRLRPSDTARAIADDAVFERVVRLAFGQRRKMLANALKDLSADDILAESEWEHLRAEQLGVSNYIELANGLTAVDV